MNIPSKIRGYLYVALAVIASCLAVGIVFFGWVSTDQIQEWAAVAVSLYAVFVGVLAKLNVTPDDPIPQRYEGTDA